MMFIVTVRLKDGGFEGEKSFCLNSLQSYLTPLFSTLVVTFRFSRSSPFSHGFFFLLSGRVWKMDTKYFFFNPDTLLIEYINTVQRQCLFLGCSLCKTQKAEKYPGFKECLASCCVFISFRHLFFLALCTWSEDCAYEDKTKSQHALHKLFIYTKLCSYWHCR